MFTPQTIRIDVGDGTEVYAGNSPDDEFWRIRSRYRITRFGGRPDLAHLEDSQDDVARVTDVGLRLEGGDPLPLLDGWDRPFESPQEITEFVRSSTAK